MFLFELAIHFSSNLGKLTYFHIIFLAVLESGAPLSSSLEEALYKCSV